MLIIIVVMIGAEWEIISGTDPRHLLFVVVGHEGNGEIVMMMEAAYEVISVSLPLIMSRRWP